jgi:hypothetical protein
MPKRLTATVAPALVAAAITVAGFARSTGSPAQRLDELGAMRPAAASHRVVDGALAAASQAAEARWIEGAQQHQMELFYQGILDAEAQKTAPARSGRGGRGCSEASIIQRESKGDPNAVNPRTGAAGTYQFMPSTWGGYGGYASAADAPPDVQKQKFDQVYAGGAGASHWGC